MGAAMDLLDVTASAHHNCTIVPPSLLMHIRDSEAASPRARNAAARTLMHSNAFRAHRGLLHIGPGTSHGPMRAIVPPELFRAIIDSPDTSFDEKVRAQSNLETSIALRGARGGQPANGVMAEGLHRILYDANKHSRVPGKEVREEGEDIALRLKDDVDFQRVWDAFGSTYAFYETIFDRNSIDGEGMDIIATVHYDDDDRPPGYNNAMWDSSLKQMIFGDGDGEVFGSFTVSIDVIAHELTHGVTDFTAHLPYHQQSGALNESLSDVFGSMVKQWVKDVSVENADWLIGEGLFVDTNQNPALRSLAKPGTAFHNVFGRGDNQPSHMNDYKDYPDTASGDWGGVHHNSGIPNHAFYLAAMELGGNSWETVGPIWYSAMLDPKLRSFASKSSNWMNVFEFFANLAVEHAGSDTAAATAVKGAWAKVGVL